MTRANSEDYIALQNSDGIMLSSRRTNFIDLIRLTGMTTISGKEFQYVADSSGPVYSVPL